MNRVPDIGEGVRVPWGLDTATGEVIDVHPPNHVVVAVSVEGASGEELGVERVSYRLDVLEELPRWRIRRVRPGTPTPGADASGAYYVDVQRNGDGARVEVRVAGSITDRTRLPTESLSALQTKGRSAVEKFAHRYHLPRVIVVGTNGVFELKS